MCIGQIGFVRAFHLAMCQTNLANGQTHSKYPSAVAVGLAFKGLKSLLPFVIYMGYHTIYIDFVNYIYRYSTIQYHSDTC